MKWGHFEMVRLSLGRKMDVNRMFAVWRIDPPWQPVTKKVYTSECSLPCQ
jgi:large subunit ribosomal protein L16